MRADGAQGLRQRLGANGLDIAQNRLTAALHIKAVITVTNSLVKIGQMIRGGDDRLADLADNVLC
jgi:hypothetical protein